MAIKPLPRKVTWTERDKKTHLKASVVKEVALREDYPWGDYYKVIQEIDNEGKTFIRFGYYKKKSKEQDSKWSWGSQTTLMLTKKNALKLLDRARNKGILQTKK